jgi:hypothetical protein
MKNALCFSVEVLWTGVIPEIILPRTVPVELDIHFEFACLAVTIHKIVQHPIANQLNQAD